MYTLQKHNRHELALTLSRRGFRGNERVVTRIKTASTQVPTPCTPAPVPTEDGASGNGFPAQLDVEALIPFFSAKVEIKQVVKLVLPL